VNFITTAWVLGVQTALIIALVSWLGNRLHNKVDAVDQAQRASREVALREAGEMAVALQAAKATIAAAAATYVPRMEMQKYLDDLRSEWQRDLDTVFKQVMHLHSENGKRLDEIAASLVRVHERMDVLPRRRVVRP
jgi:hypothetical protein